MLLFIFEYKKSGTLAKKNVFRQVTCGHVLFSVKRRQMRKLFEKPLVTSDDRENTMGSHFEYHAGHADNEQVKDPIRLH